MGSTTPFRGIISQKQMQMAECPTEDDHHGSRVGIPDRVSSECARDHFLARDCLEFKVTVWLELGDLLV